MACNPFRRRFQKSCVESAPGNRHAMPIMATGSLEAPRPSRINLTGTVSVETDVGTSAADGGMGFTCGSYVVALNCSGPFRNSVIRGNLYLDPGNAVRP